MRLPQRHAASLVLLSLCVALLAATPAGADPFGDFRGLWISRFEYNQNSAADIQDRINRAADMGITDVIWQVRAKSDAYYNSNFETPAENWNGSVDPLQVALDTAHARGMELHAWLNTMPIWRDTPAPNDPNHIFYNTDPSFRVTDINGNVEQVVGGQSSFTGNTYARVNHVLPEVQTHINNVVEDIATNYDVDGIHLDYIRWLGPNGGSSEGFRPDWDFLPHDPVSHQLYLDETGGNGAAGATFNQRESYRDWVQGKITELVSSVKATVDAAEISEQRDIELSAAVWNNPTTAERDYLQDYRTWMQQDLLDITIPMVYLRNSNNNLLDGFLDDIFSTPTNSEVSIGLGTYLHTNTASGGGVPETINQINEVYNDGRADSLTFFSYGSLLDGSSLSNQRRQAVVDWYDALDPTVDPPPTGNSLAAEANLLSGFDLPGDEGYFASSITAGGQTTIDSSSSAEQTSSMSHEGAGSQLLDIDASGSWTLRHLSGGASASGNEPLAAEGSVGFWLKTDDEGLTVQIAVDDPGTADRGTLKSVVADGEWHLYEWDLEDDSQWEGWVTGDGEITGPTLTLDSIFLYGSGDATVFLDTVAHNPSGSLLAPSVPGDFDGDGDVDGGDFGVFVNSFQNSPEGGPPYAPGDFDGDGDVDGGDFGVFVNSFQNFPPGSEAAIPEPTAAALWLAAVGLAGVAARRGAS